MYTHLSYGAQLVIINRTIMLNTATISITKASRLIWYGHSCVFLCLFFYHFHHYVI